MSDARHIIAHRCALALRDGEVVNLGIGIPTLVPSYLPPGRQVVLHTENGAFGFARLDAGEVADSDCANASGEPMALPPGAAVMDLATSLGAARNGYIDTTILGGLEVDEEGTLANWASRRGARWWPGIGGAMDLCHGVKRVIAALQHVDRKGQSKLRRRTALPPTGRGCVSTIITDRAVFDVVAGGLLLREVHPGFGVAEIRAATEASFTVADDLREMALPPARLHQMPGVA